MAQRRSSLSVIGIDQEDILLTRDVAKGIHRIEDAYTNWYLIEEDGKLTIVDCGLPASWSSFESALSAIDRQKSDVEAVVLTHAHFDHIGFAERARSELGVPVLLHENDYPLTRQPHQYSHLKSRVPYFFNRRAAPVQISLVKSRAFWPKPISEVQRFSEDAGQLSVPGSPSVIFTPGHTLGHCAFHLPDRDAVIVGDALVMMDPYTGEVGSQMVSAAATADMERALDSLTKISDTGATIVLTGHGEPWAEGAAEAVRVARAAPLT